MTATSHELAPIVPVDVGPPPARSLGWPHVVVGKARERPLERMVVGGFGLVLGASTGMFVGGMLGIVLTLLLLPFVPELVVSLLVVTSFTCCSAGAVVGARLLLDQTFDDAS